MKIASAIAGGLLGLLFIFASLTVLLKLMPMPPPPPEGTPPALFMGALFPTGYFTFVKILELLGGILVAIPRTRNLGLLILVPIIVNILAFHVFITKCEGLFDPILILIILLTGFLLWSGRKAFAGLLR